MGRWNWGPDGPPEDAYSRVTEPERFAPLHPFALDLLNQLQRKYRVDRSENPLPSFDIAPNLAVRPAITLTPQNAPSAAAIEVVFTNFPGLIVRFGRAHLERFPDCGCDACDETFEDQAEGLKWRLSQVAAGRYREGVGDECEFWDLEGSRHRRGDPDRRSDAVVEWQPWAVR
jgi:hypothetical protein